MDKIRYNSCKTIISRVIDNEEMPYSDYIGKENNIDAVISPLSIVSRMTSDIYNSLYLGKEIKYLKRKIKEMLQ